MTKGPTQKEAITLINIHAPNTGASKYIQQILIDIKGEIDNNTITVGKFIAVKNHTERKSISNSGLR